MVRRNFLRGHAVDGGVPLIAPRDCAHALQENEGDQRQADQPSFESAQFTFHIADYFAPGLFAPVRSQSERQMQRELQEAWAANRVLDHAQATLRGESMADLRNWERSSRRCSECRNQDG